MTSVLMSSWSSAGSTSAMRKSARRSSCARIFAWSRNRNSARLPGVRATTREPSGRVRIRLFTVPPLGAGVLDQERDALPAADAGRGQAVARPAAPQLVHQGQHQARARGAQRVAQADRAAVDVAALAIEPQLLLAGHVLGREGLVDLDA